MYMYVHVSGSNSMSEGAQRVVFTGTQLSVRRVKEIKRF